MSTIHTARNLVGNDKTTPLFSLKGLANLAPSTVTGLNIQGIPLERQVAYTQYSANIASFIHAAATGKTVIVGPRPLALLRHMSVIPLPPPTVSFTLQKPLDSDRSDRFISILGPGASKTQSGKTTIYHAPLLPDDILSSVTSICTPFFNAGRDAINPKGMRAYIFINNVISLFLKVHSYPAFRTEDEHSLTSFEQLLGGTTDGNYFSQEFSQKDEKTGVEAKHQRNMLDKSHTVNEFGKRDRDTDDMDEDASPYEKTAKSAAGFVRYRGSDTVFRAHAPKTMLVNIGSPSLIPRSPGHIFPYFHGLIQPDAVFINSILLRRFYQLMGDTHESCQSFYLDLRHGVNSLASTERGMEICHALLGIDLALSTQSRCFIIIEKNKYLGFSLLGARYAIFSSSRWYAPVSEDELQIAISRMDPHESAVSDMIKKLEGLSAKEQYTGSTERSIFSEPKALSDAIDKLKISDIDEDDIRELDRCVRNLNYMGASYLTQNPQMITELFDTIASNKSIELSRPTFLPSIRAPLKSKLFILLSRFGPEAPSLWNDRGTEITCKSVEKSVAATGGKRKVGESDIYGNMPSRILVTPKPLLVAVKDMERVLEKGKVKMDVGERAGKHRTVAVEHEETRKKMWKAMVEMCVDSGKKPRVNPESDGTGTIDIDDVMFKLLGSG
jgi:hypothetical protein